MRQLKTVALILLLMGLSACATRGGDVRPVAGMPETGSYAVTPYYVEFHSRPSIISGHTFLVYGPQEASGLSREPTVVGFYPIGGIVGLLGGMIGAPGKVEKAYLDEKLPDVNVYRRNLTAEQYEHLTQFVAQEQAKTKVWNMFLNNCNDFAADAAKAIGLKVPSDRFVPPPIFIMALSDMNA